MQTQEHKHTIYSKATELVEKMWEDTERAEEGSELDAALVELYEAACRASHC